MTCSKGLGWTLIDHLNDCFLTVDNIFSLGGLRFGRIWRPMEEYTGSSVTVEWFGCVVYQSSIIGNRYTSTFPSCLRAYQVSSWNELTTYACYGGIQFRSTDRRREYDIPEKFVIGCSVFRVITLNQEGAIPHWMS